VAKIDLTDDLTQDVFDFLVRLRDSGVTNMWGAAPYIAQYFEMDDKMASKYLVAWIQTFKEKETNV